MVENNFITRQKDKNKRIKESEKKQSKKYINEQRMKEKAQAGNSMRHLRDIIRGVTDGRTDGRTDGQTLLLRCVPDGRI